MREILKFIAVWIFCSHCLSMALLRCLDIGNMSYQDIVLVYVVSYYALSLILILVYSDKIGKEIKGVE